MKSIHTEDVQRRLDAYKGQPIYLHLEMTTGAYASHQDSTKLTASTFISNAIIRYSHGLITGHGPYRVGLKTGQGWVYSEGLTHWDDSDNERLIMAGHDQEGKLVVGLQLSSKPFGTVNECEDITEVTGNKEIKK
ncbi:YojF family protein [Paenibacillus taiwanensis]|uniref:YojF family protein n=1 Tax=Paenibacillus taiwanensis TaxID=401638 RepID=UPI0004226FBD|nr:YojF family protein [Paenibacillus taiwanensis]